MRLIFHKIADIKWLERRKNSKSVAPLINDQHKAEIEFNRINLSKIIKIIIFLAKQGIPFRGHSESLESANRGNLKELEDLLATNYSIDLKKFLKKNLNGNYLSLDIQNEILAISASNIRNKIKDEVRESKFFSIFFDGTSDISHKEQISFCILFCTVGLEIKEKFIGFFEAASTTGENMYNIVKKVLSECCLEMTVPQI
ncbi:unnamed protein product [Brachionus calyciflorus]|uniref:DUF4371 domain-containing protein n=1 Tax=Brachionus calyciflorus TaxID=104777 RepID=A0A814LMW8_9BILA|nr:unnamed protein product [Brachionus calyciflorus]